MRNSQTNRPKGAKSWSALFGLVVLACAGFSAPAAWAAGPPNDNFSSAIVIFGPAGTTLGSNDNATVEPGEPVHGITGGIPAKGQSIWYQWTATANGYFTFDTVGSAIDTDLAVYTGDSVTHLTCVVRDDNFPNLTNGASQVTFLAQAGTVYDIAVDTARGPSGGVQLNWWSGIAGHLQWASDQTGGVGHALYLVSESDGVGGGQDNGLTTVPSLAGARVTVTRLHGATGRINVNWTVTALNYIDMYSTNLYITNIVSSNAVSGQFTNSATTNFVATSVIQNYVNGQLGGYTCLSASSVGSTNINGATSSLTTGFTNILADTNVCRNFMFSTNDGTNFVLTNIICTNLPIATVTNPTALPSDWGGVSSGVITMNDYQMAADLLFPFSTVPFTTNKTVNRLFVVTLTNAVLDPQESTNLQRPTIDTSLGTAFVNISSQQIDPSSPCVQTNAIVNWEREALRTRTDFSGQSRVAVIRTGVVANDNKVDYRLDYAPLGGNNTFPAQAGSDYAVPNVNFTVQSGTLDFPPGANNNSQFIVIPVFDKGVPDFNRDIYLTIVPTPGTQPNPPVIGYVPNANVTLVASPQPPGALDRNHDRDHDLATHPPANPNPGANQTVYAVAVQPDGSTVLAGDFTTFNQFQRNHIARMDATGQIDFGFLPSPNTGADGSINALVLQPDGRMLIGGQFNSFNGTNRHSIARLNSDGSLDLSFNPGLGIVGTVWSIALQANGQLVLGGSFTSINGTNRAYIARLNPDGSLDTTFGFDPTGTIPAPGPDNVVQAVAIQGGDKVIIGGDFGTVNGTNRSKIARLNSDGSLDLIFDPGTGANGTVYALAVEPANNAVLVGGAFSSLNLANRNSIGRLTANGALDATFNPGSGADSTVYTLTIQPDGNIMVGGIFVLFNGTRRVAIARIFDNGTVDTSIFDTAYNQYAGFINSLYNPNTSQRNYIFAIGLEQSGNYIVGGGFSQVGASFYSAIPLVVGGPPDSTLSLAPNGMNTVTGTREEVRNRANVTRLLGGQVNGPGNLSLVPDDPATGSYTVDENAGQEFITLVRNNGNLGIAAATLTACAPPPGPGAAVEGPIGAANADYYFDDSLYGNPVFNWEWPTVFIPKSTGSSGQNNLIGSPVVELNIIGDNVVDPNKSLSFSLSNPGSGDHFLLGSEVIPLASALGSKVGVPDTIVDNNVAHGVLSFSQSAYSASENAGTAVINVFRANGSAGQVTVGFATIDGTGIGFLPPFAAIAGTTNDYIGTNGTLTFGPGVTNLSFAVRMVNNSLVQPDRTLGLILVGPTGGATAGLTNATLTIIDDDFGPGHVNFAATNFVAHESDGAATITVTRTGGNQGVLSVHYMTSDGTASNLVNYGTASNILTWSSGDTVPKTFTVPVLRDGNVTSNLFANLSLFNASVNGVQTNAALGLTNATLTIINDDQYGSPSFSTATYSVNENAGTAIITVVRQGGNAQSITVNYTTSQITAQPTVNYDETAGTLTFGPGEFTKTFPITIHDDPTPNGDLTLAITLSTPTPSGVTLGGIPVAVLTIVDQQTHNQPPGGVDSTFNPGGTFFNDTVYGVALQTDHRILAVGDFTMANDVARNRIARLNADGTLDLTFSSGVGGADTSIRAVMVQSTDGRIMVGGLFSKFNGINRGRFARLNLDGSLDGSFNPGSGADNPVYALAETALPSGTNLIHKLLLGGGFASINGTPVNGIARLNDDGTVDMGFAPAGNPSGGANGIVYALAVYSTNDFNGGKILIGGDFTAVNGVPRNHIARLNADGTLDASFDPGPGPDSSVRAIAIQVDGNVVIGGLFTFVSGSGFNHIARLLPNGTVDPGFVPGPGANDIVTTLALQPDLKIVVGGAFTQANGVTRNRLTRLNPDGSVDPDINFGLGANDFITSMAVQPWDSLIVVGGGFTSFDGQSSPHIARIFGRSATGNGAFTFTQSSYQVIENATNAVIGIRRTGGTGDPNSTNYITFETSDITAVAGTDYTGVTNTIGFPVGETFATVTVPVSNNFIIDPDRFVNLTLVNPTNPVTVAQPVLGAQPFATLAIINDDSDVSFAAAAETVPKNAVNGAALISVVRNGSSVGSASVDFATTLGGTAVPGTDFTPTTNTVVFADGETNKLVAVPVINNGIVEGNRTVTLALSNPTNTILLSPTASTLTIIDTAQVPGSVTFSQAGYSVNETGTNAVITVIRTNGSLGQISVHFDASGGTAAPGVNYTPTNNTLVFADGELSKTFLVPVIHNPIVEGDKTVNLTLSAPSGGATIIGLTNATLTIVDVDVGVAFALPGYFVNETAGSVTLTIQRVGGAATPFSVQYATTNSTAIAGTNYTATSGTLNFAANEPFKTIDIPILHDPRVQGNLIFFVGLSLTTGAVAQLANPSITTVTVIDTDSGLAFASPTNSVSEAGTNAVISVLRTGSTVGSVSVNYSVGGGTASPSRYVATNGVLTFADGQISNTFIVPIINNSLVDGDATVNLTLSSPTNGAQLLFPSNSVLTIIDDDSGFSFSSSSYSVSEGGFLATITVVRSGVTNTNGAVNFATSDGTAHANRYVPTNGTVTFTNGQISQTFTVQIIDNNIIDGNGTVLLTLSEPTGVLLNPNAATLTIIDNDGGLVVPAGTALIGESGPVNGVIDPGETVTNLFAFRDSAGQNTSNLVATLLATNGISAPSGPQAYGVLVVGGPSKSQPFSFTANGTNGSQITATFKLQDGTNTTTATFNFILGKSTTSFTNSGVITINDSAPATPYPSTNVVSGVGGVMTKLTVTVSNLAHTSLSDVGILLVGPTGQKALLMNDIAFHLAGTNLTLTFDDAAANSLPANSVPTNGVYKPTAIVSAPNFFAPAPAGPYATSLAGFIGTNPNGNWLLYVQDDVGGDFGVINSGWSLAITASSPVAANADLAAGLTAAPAPAIVNSNLTYTLSVTNFGPAGATNVQVTDPLPAGVTYVSASAPGGAVNNGGTVTFNFGTLATNTSTTATLTVTPTAVGNVTNTITASADQVDANPGNNSLSLITAISAASADMAISLSGAPNPVLLGGNVTFTIVVTNLGPATATNIIVTNTLPVGLIPVSAPGGSTNVAGVVTWNVGTLGSGGTASVTLVAKTTIAGNITNTVNVGSGISDPLKGNNSASVKIESDAVQLSASRGPNSLTFTWSAGFVLQSTPTLSPANWTPVTNPVPQFSGGSSNVTVSTASGTKFYRLQQTGP